MDKLLKKKRKALEDENDTALCSACSDLADYYIKEEEFLKAIKEYEVLAKIYKKQKKMIDFATAYRGIGEAYMLLNDFNKAIEHQKIYLGLSKQQDNKLEEQRALAVLGHTYLTKYIGSREDKNDLTLAHKYTIRSLEVSQRLTDIKKFDLADLTARLYNNLGVIEEFQGHHEKSLEFFNKAIVLCKANDIYESLHQAYNSLASSLERRGEYNKAIQNFNLAIETAKKFKNKDSALCDCLISKANILLKLGNIQAAKKSLHKAYKLKLSRKSKEEVERKLKIVVNLCRVEKEMISETCLGTDLQKFYEKMGDGFSSLGCYDRALTYYHKMLEQSRENNSDLAPSYYSLAATYKDLEHFNKAIEYFEKEYPLCEFKKGLDTLCEIADAKENKGCLPSEVIQTYERAINSCKTEKNLREEGRMLERLMNYLNRINYLDQIPEYKKRFDETGFVPSDSEESSQHGNSEDDICLEDLTDESEDSECDSPNKKRRPKTFQVRRNLRGETQLHTACISGKANVVKHLLDQGHPINIRDNGGWLPLHDACISGHLDVVKLLLDKGAAINDGGGTHCNGTTPLHDAAVNAHLEIIELLLDRGASALSKTGDGETPYHYLKKASLDTEFDEGKKKMCEKLLNRMSTILDRAGQSKEISSNVQNSAFVAGQSEEQNYRRRRIQRRSVDEEVTYSYSGRIGGNRSNDNIDGEAEPREKVSVPKTQATYEYQMVMDNLRKKPNELPRTASSESLKRSAFVMNYEDNDDDWLEDDLGIMKSDKKRKMSSPNAFVDTLFTRSNIITDDTRKRRDSTKSTSSKGSVSKNKSPMKRIRRSDSVETNSSGKSDMLRAPSTENIFINDDSMDNFDTHIEITANKQSTLFDSGFNRCTIPSETFGSRSRLSQKRAIQPKITHFGRDSPIKVSQENFCNNRLSSSPNYRPSQSPAKSALFDNDPMLAMDVNIEGRPFRVTTRMSLKNTLTVKWLALEAARRYAKKEYVEPVLELTTQSGAELVDDDSIGTLFITDNQVVEVNAKVLKWNVPLIRERYKEACSDMNTHPLEMICQKLDSLTISLDIKNNGLRPDAVAPLCKALLRENRLLELDFSNNFFSLDCMKYLAASLPTLEHLTRLNLSCTNLHAEEMRCLSNMILNSPVAILTKLHSLDISENFICDENLQDIASITKHLSLKELNISLLSFTEDVFNKSYNRSVTFDFKNIEILNLSGNNLGNSALEKFLSFVDSSRLANLDISNNTTSSGFLASFINCLCKDGARLNFENLNLCRCLVEDSEIFNLLRCCDNLETLNLSYTEITSLSLRRLLECPFIRQISLLGCKNLNKYFDCSENIWTLENYLPQDSRPSQIKSLRITCDIDKSCILKKLWKEKHCDEKNIKEEGNLLILN